MGGVTEGAHHAGDVLERRLHRAAFFRGARRLTLEVQHHEIAARPQHLAQMEVAVNAGLLQHHIGFLQAAKGLQHLPAPRQQQAHQLDQIVGQRGQP